LIAAALSPAPAPQSEGPVSPSRLDETKPPRAASATAERRAPAPVVEPSRPSGARTSAVPVPASGAYFGAWTSSTTGHILEQREAQIGRQYNIVHVYHDWDDQFPDAREQAWADGGRTLFFAVEPRIYGSSRVIPWRAIAAGEEDATLDAMAARVKALGHPVLIDFSHEPEGRSSMGTPQEFAAAFRHVHARFQAEGATNVAWVWTIMGYPAYYGVYAGGLYPGDDVVDWIAWDPFNWYLCHGSAWKSFADEVAPFYTWLMSNGHSDKPFMLAEYGTRESDSDALAKGRWFRDALSTLKGGAFPNLKALVYFDSNHSDCDWGIDTSQASLDGFRELASDPYLNPKSRRVGRAPPRSGG
jgi:hypothetical protein